MPPLAHDRQDAEGLTRKLADYSSRLRFDSLPADVVSIARCCLLDWLGVTLVGAQDELSQILRAEADEAGGSPQASVIGGGKTALLQAAVLNGAASHALDYDDVNVAMVGHPTVVVVPGILALAERDASRGEAFVTAYVAGVEMACRIGTLMGESHYTRGWHTTGTVGTFGAAAACAHLLGLDLDATVRAYGIAATQAAGLKSNFGTMCKPLHAGRAAANGLNAALLARRGFTSNPEILECVQGFGATQTNDFHPNRALEGLGETFHTRNMLFKYHAACYGTHAPIEAAREIRSHHGIAPDDVASIEVRVPPSYLQMCNILEPTTAMEAKFSLRFTVAMALAGEETGRIDAYTDASCRNPVLCALRDKATAVADERLGHAKAEVIVSTRDGKLLRQSGDASTPETDQAHQWERIVEKFRGLAAPVLGENEADQVVAQVSQLETLTDLLDIANLCRTGKA